jgi:hypothetical protein
MTRVRNNAETLLVAQIRLELGKRNDCIIFRNSVGYDEEKRVKYGLMKGSSDLIGLVKPSGRMIVLEVKLPGWKKPRNAHEREQAEFIEMIKQAGGHGAFATSVAEANAHVAFAIGTCAQDPRVRSRLVRCC